MDRNRTVVAYCCENSAVKAAASLGDAAIGPGVEIIPVPCAGRVELGQLLRPIEQGAERVVVLACPLDNCTYVHGNRRTQGRVEAARSALSRAGLDPDRISMHMVSSVDTHKLLQALVPVPAEQQREEKGA